MRASKFPRLVAALALTALAMLPGCMDEEAANYWSTAAPVAGEVNLARDVQFEDIPMPQGYMLNTNASFSFQGSNSRSGMFTYFGPVEWTEALRFFRSQMPMAGWTPGATERGFDFRVLHFRKGEEQLILTVRQISGGSSAEVQLDNISKNDLLLKGKLPSTVSL